MTGILLLASALFCVGVYGVLSQKNAVGILVAVELMVNAVTIVLAGFARAAGTATLQSFVLFVIAITVAEVVVGLAILLLLYRAKGDVSVDLATSFKG